MNRAQRRRQQHEGRAGQSAADPILLALFRDAEAAVAAGAAAQAESLYARCLARDPRHVAARHDLGVLTLRGGRPDEAARHLRQALAVDPAHVGSWTNLALALSDAGAHAEARAAAARAIALRPSLAAAHAALGHVLARTADLEGARDAFRKALSLDRSLAPVRLHYATLLRRLGAFEQSLAQADLYVAANPQDPRGHIERAATLAAQGELEEAAQGLRGAMAHDTEDGAAVRALAAQLAHFGQISKGIEELDAAIEKAPAVAALHSARADLHRRKGKRGAALADLQACAALRPDDPQALFDLGAFLQQERQYVAATAAFLEAIALRPDFLPAYANLAIVRMATGDVGAAIALFRHAASLAPDNLRLTIDLNWARLSACDWTGLEEDIAVSLQRCVAAGEPYAPFSLLALGLPDQDLLLWTRAWAQARLGPPAERLSPLRPPATRAGRRRIRVGYLSADFKNHATATLIADLLRLHDRDRFEVFGYNIGAVDSTVFGQRMIGALDRFTDLSPLDDREAALTIAEDGLDILVDLKGYTTESRSGILGYRPAPIQVNYLGYPGTMGTSAIDYILADAVVAPAAHQPLYDEALVHLPNCYQPNDRERPAADPDARREDHGLPADAMVFCCFNTNYKITPLVFGVWMRLLRDVPGAVMWLLRSNAEAEANLVRAATGHGIDPGRLVFAPRVPVPEHIARFGLADLFLDTLPVNAHTTASEALWAGVPVLTVLGPRFVGRVAASLLTAVGLPELITADLQAYEREALALALDRPRLQAIRRRLAEARATTSLFDTPRYARSYMAALEHMMARWREGLAPAPFAVAEPADPDQAATVAPLDAAEEAQALRAERLPAVAPLVTPPFTPGRHLQDCEAVAVRRHGGLGDVLMALSALSAIKRTAPQAKVLLETSPAFREIASACPAIDGVFTDAKDMVASIRAAGLKQVRYLDWSPARYGTAEIHEVDAFLTAAGLAVPDADKGFVLDLGGGQRFATLDFALAGIPAAQRKVVIHAGLSDRNRTWPVAFWSDLVNRLVAAGHAVIAIGRSTFMDGKSATSIDHPAVLDLVDRLSLVETVHLLRRSDLLISGDAGPVQLAGAAPDIGVIGLYSVVAGANRLPYRGGSPFHRAVAVDPSCPFHPCFPHLRDAAAMERFRLREGLPENNANAVFAHWCLNPDRYSCITDPGTPPKVWKAVEELLAR